MSPKRKPKREDGTVTVAVRIPKEMRNALYRVVEVQHETSPWKQYGLSDAVRELLAFALYQNQKTPQKP